MNITKKDIANKIADELDLNIAFSKNILNSFLNILKNEGQQKKVKISNFGTIYTHKTLKRIGRNPKTMEEFTIPSKKVLKFKASNKIKDFIN